MKKRNNILIYSLVIMGFVFILTNGCKKDTTTTTPTTVNVVKTEVWRYVIDSNINDTARLTHTKKSDGGITTSGYWNYIYQNQQVVCQVQNTALTVNDTIYSFTATGTATNASAPVGIQTSPFTLVVSGVTHNGTSKETYDIYFTQYMWPSHKNGFSRGTRTSGSGVTN